MLQKKDVTFIIFLFVFFIFFAVITILNSNKLADITTTVNQEQLDQQIISNPQASWFERNKKFIAVDVIILSIAAIILIFLFFIRKKIYSLWEAE